MRSSLAIDDLSAHCAHNALPEVWLELAHGRISSAAAAAAMEGREPAELVERSAVLFEPPSAEAEARRLEALLRAHFPAPARRRRVPRWVQAGVVALAAAGLVLVLVPTRAPRFDAGYGLALSPGHLEERDDPGRAEGITRYREGQRIELRLRPRATVEEEVSAVAFAVAAGRGTRLRAEPEVNAHGVVVIAGTPEALGLAVGRWRLVVVVGPPERLPAAYEDVQTDAEAPYDVVEGAVEIVAALVPEP